MLEQASVSFPSNTVKNLLRKNISARDQTWNLLTFRGECLKPDH